MLARRSRSPSPPGGRPARCSGTSRCTLAAMDGPRSRRGCGPTCSTTPPAPASAVRSSTCAAPSGRPPPAHLEATREHVGLQDAWTDAAAAAALAAAGARRGRARPVARRAAGRAGGGRLADGRARRAARRQERAAGRPSREQAAAAGDHAAAVACARERVALEPLSEEAHRDLIVRLADAGDRAAAVTAYTRLAGRLRTELGIAPSRATRDLAARIRTGDGDAPALDGDDEVTGDAHAAGAPPLPAVFAARRERSPFVGATASATGCSLRSTASAAASGNSCSYRASPGSASLGSSPRPRGGRTWPASRCSPAAASEEPLGPFAPFVEALRPLGELHAAPAADPGAARLRMFDAAAELLAGASAARAARPRGLALGRSGDAAPPRPPGDRAGARRAAAARHVPPDGPGPPPSLRRPCSRTCAASRGPSGSHSTVWTRRRRLASSAAGWAPRPARSWRRRCGPRRRATRSSSRRSCATWSRAARSSARTAAGARTAPSPSPRAFARSSAGASSGSSDAAVAVLEAAAVCTAATSTCRC